MTRGVLFWSPLCGVLNVPCIWIGISLIIWKFMPWFYWKWEVLILVLVLLLLFLLRCTWFLNLSSEMPQISLQYPVLPHTSHLCPCWSVPSSPPCLLVQTFWPFYWWGFPRSFWVLTVFFTSSILVWFFLGVSISL